MVAQTAACRPGAAFRATTKGSTPMAGAQFNRLRRVYRGPARCGYCGEQAGENARIWHLWECPNSPAEAARRIGGPWPTTR